MTRAFLTLMVALATALAGCESKDEASSSDAESASATQPSQPQFQRLKLATQPATLPAPPPGWKPATEPSFTTAPTTMAAATTVPTSRPDDPQANPESTVRHFLELVGAPIVPPIEMVVPLILEPPPRRELESMLDRIRGRLLKGATWEIVQTHAPNTAATVVYRTNYRGRTLIGSFLLHDDHDRWKIVLGEVTPRKYTSIEKDDMHTEVAWSQERVTTLQAAANTQPTTTTAPTTRIAQ